MLIRSRKYYGGLSNTPSVLLLYYSMSGELVFDNGETTQNISLTVHRDMIPELLEVAYVRFVKLDVNSK